MTKKFFRTSMAALTAASVIACTSAVFAAPVHAAESEIAAQAEAETGMLTETISWTLQDGMLTIRGEGEMPEFDDNKTFRYRDDINKVIIEEGVKGHICGGMFNDCGSLTEVLLSSGITRIEDWAFQDCRSLTTIALPDGMQYIGNSAFADCDQLDGLILSNNITYIGSEAFYRSGLTKIVLPSSLTEMGAAVFKSCDESLRISYSGTMDNFGKITGVSSACFGRTVHCTDGDYTPDTIEENINENLRYSLKDGVLTFTGIGSIPNVSMLSPYVSTIKKIVINEGITGLDYYAFSGFSWTDTLSLPSTLISIKTDAFSGCDQLTQITYNGTEEKLRSISGAGKELYKKQVTCSDGICIFDTLRGNINDSISYEFSDGILTLIGTGELPYGYELSQALNGLDSATTKVVISEGITKIQEWSFSLDMYNWFNLVEVSLPKTLESIGMNAFEVYNLTSISYNGTSEELYKIDGVAREFLNKTVKCSDEDCFIDKIQGTIGDNIHFEISDGILTLSGTGTVTQGNSELYFYQEYYNKIVIQEGITEIGDYAIVGAYTLTEISLPDSLAVISNNAFDSCNSLSEIHLPSNVTTIRDYAFNGCTSLKRVYLPASVTSMGSNVFINCPSDLQVMYAGTRDEVWEKGLGNYADIMYFSRANAGEVIFDKADATVNTDARAYVVRERVNMANPTWKIDVKKGDETRTIFEPTGIESVIGDIVYGVVLYDFDGAEITRITLE